MSTELPLKIRVDIRDQWDSPKSGVQKSIDALTGTLGHKIVPHVQWVQFYTALKDVYPDKTLFIPTIARVVITFYARLLAKVDDEANSEWTDQLLQELAKKPDSSWLFQIQASTGSRPKAALKVNLGVFMLEIPSRDLPMNAQVDSGFDQDLDNLFSAESSASLLDSTANDDEWAEVVHGNETHTSNPAISSAPVRLALPAVETLSRPADLFRNTTLYFLTVDARSNPLVIQSSHQPSLELLASYLKKWAKTNMNDSAKVRKVHMALYGKLLMRDSTNPRPQRPILKVTLIESAFFFGVIDAVEIEPMANIRSPVALNPTMILAFVEGVLGYKETHTTGSQWVFKLETPLK